MRHVYVTVPSQATSTSFLQCNAEEGNFFLLATVFYILRADAYHFLSRKKMCAGMLPVSILTPPRPYTGQIFPAYPTEVQPIAPPPLYEAAVRLSSAFIERAIQRKITKNCTQTAMCRRTTNPPSHNPSLNHLPRAKRERHFQKPNLRALATQVVGGTIKPRKCYWTFRRLRHVYLCTSCIHYIFHVLPF